MRTQLKAKKEDSKMKAQEVANHFAPFGALVNKAALSENYKALVLTPTSVRGMSAFGAMETEIALGIDQEVAVEGDAFLQILRSMPAADLKLSVSEGTLRWRCGQARGQLAVMGSKVAVGQPPWPDKLEVHEVKEDFARGLDLGSLACGTTALLSVGLYGIHVVNADGSLVAYSSDNTTMARARLGDEIPGAASSFTISPDGSRLIVMLAQRGKMAVQFDDATIYCQTPDTRLVVKQTPPIKMDLRGIADTYLGEEIKIELNRDVISSFIRRSEALAEERGKAGVTLSVDEGAVKLEFSEGRASSEEYYLAEGGPKVSVAPISVDARRLGRALSHAAHVVFDYAGKSALVLRGGGGFAFVIAARTAAEKKD